MAEKYTETLLNWDKDAKRGDIKVTRVEEVKLSEDQVNVHEQTTVFPKTPLSELSEGLSKLQKSRDNILEEQTKKKNKELEVRKRIQSINGVATMNEELLNLARKIENIGMIRELDKIKENKKELLDNFEELNDKIIARKLLLKNIEEQ